MIAELVLVVCLSPKECITVRNQMETEKCAKQAEAELQELGRNPDNPPYLQDHAKCVLLGTWN